MSQADADNCCAASERPGSTSAERSTMAAAITLALLDGPAFGLPIISPVRYGHAHLVEIIPATPVPRHLLLSVFLL